MRKASTLIGLTLLTFGAPARAQDNVPAIPAPGATAPSGAAATSPGGAVVAPVPDSPPVSSVPPPAPPPRSLEIGLSVLSMGLGNYSTPIGGLQMSGDASYAYGVSLSASYRVIGGLNLGVAPQLISNVRYKVFPSQIMPPPAAKQYDFMARVAYEFALADSITPYLELLPGYSIIALPGTTPAKGFVLAAGAGIAMDMSERIFLNLGFGYQWGYQKVSQAGTVSDNKTTYLRLALGGGVRF
jgi:hypothetical protein